MQLFPKGVSICLSCPLLSSVFVSSSQQSVATGDNSHCREFSCQAQSLQAGEVLQQSSQHICKLCTWQHMVGHHSIYIQLTPYLLHIPSTHEPKHSPSRIERTTFLWFNERYAVLVFCFCFCFCFFFCVCCCYDHFGFVPCSIFVQYIGIPSARSQTTRPAHFRIMDL